MSKNLNLGWVGAGVMGAPLCGHLMAAGYTLRLTTRTRSRAEQLIEQGAIWCDTPAEVAEADVIFTMVGTPDEVETIYFGETGLFSGNIEGKTFIDMGTTPPSLTIRIDQAAKAASARTIDAPVSGGDVGARNAQLSIMAGGDEKEVERLRPLFEVMGSVRYLGSAGSGQHTKLCNQLSVAGTMIGVCEALVYAERAGLDVKKMIEAIRPGAAGCWTLDNLAPRIADGDFAPGFMVDHFIKDLGIALREADNMEIDLPGLALAHRLYQRTNELGHGASGTQALYLALRKVA